MDSLRDFLISFSSLVEKYDNEGDDCPFTFVFTDETFIYRTHAATHSYFGNESTINKTGNKGLRLIVLHAITPKGQLCVRINGIPFCDLLWNGDTPHPTDCDDRKSTCELLWKAQSSTGNYHDNMISDMFMKWVKERLVPTFELLHPNKKMILICDNAPYHHSREIGSLANKKVKISSALRRSRRLVSETASD
jgi:hypothetical protein